MLSDSLPKGPPRRKKNLLDDIREVMRLRHYSIRTEQAYIHWVKRFCIFHQMKHPRKMGIPEIDTFLFDDSNPALPN